MHIELNVLITFAVSFVSVGIAYSRWSRDIKKDNEERQREIAQEREKQTERHIEITKGLEYLTRDVDKINNNVSNVINRVDEIDRRVTINEQSIKSAHHRIDGIENNCRSQSQ